MNEHQSEEWQRLREAEAELAKVCIHLNTNVFAFPRDQFWLAFVAPKGYTPSWHVLPADAARFDYAPHGVTLELDPLHHLFVRHTQWKKTTHFEFSWSTSPISKYTSYYGKNRPEVNIARSKTPARIAKELCRRFFPIYWEEYPPMLEQYHHNVQHEKDTAETLAALGVKPYQPNGNEGALKINGHKYSYSLRASGLEVSKLELTCLTRAQALAVIETLKGPQK